MKIFDAASCNLTPFQTSRVTGCQWKIVMGCVCAGSSVFWELWPVIFFHPSRFSCVVMGTVLMQTLTAVAYVLCLTIMGPPLITDLYLGKSVACVHGLDANSIIRHCWPFTHLSWRVQNIVVIGPVYSKLERSEFSSNFKFDRNMLSGTGAKVTDRKKKKKEICTQTYHTLDTNRDQLIRSVLVVEPPTMLLVPICRDMQLWWDKPPILSPRKRMPGETCFDDIGRICACVTWTQMYVTLQTKNIFHSKAVIILFLINLFVSFFPLLISI